MSRSRSITESGPGRKRARLDSVRAGAVGLLFQTSRRQTRLGPAKKTSQRVLPSAGVVYFFNDPGGGQILSLWGEDNCMWSKDFLHGNSTWPKSREVVARDLGTLPAKLRAKLVRENVAKVYNIPIPTPVQ